MAEMNVIIFVVLSFVCVYCAALSGKALFCRDPDSGKLHAVNTSWPSSSFCGNYTCKLRRRNITETEYSPLRQLNVTMHDHSVDKNKIVTTEKKIEPDIPSLLHKNWNSDPKNMINNDSEKLQSKTVNGYEQKDKHKYVFKPDIKANSYISKPQNDGDRYLTENEIKSIANVLHTVKKSDLDAIVDIYNLAQDIYNEMDKVTDEQMVDEALNLIKEEEKHKIPTIKPTSYWYNPTANKGKMADRYDMEHQSTNTHSTVKPRTIVPTYFNGPLTRKDFGKLPYYYPMSDFQRMSSYTHQPSQTGQTTKETAVETTKKECNSKSIRSKPKLVPQKLIQPSLLLPYPFTSIHNYNISDYASNVYYKLNPWTLDYYNKYKFYQPYYNTLMAPISKAILMNPHLSNEVQDEEQKPIKHIDENNSMFHRLISRSDSIPHWKTEPLSADVLKDIRANVDTSNFIKAFPLRRKVKIDRVGKVIKIDDINNLKERGKRSSSIQTEAEIEIYDNLNSEEYEPYIEKITCETHTDPGFFRMGNLTHPYPDCCPKKIETR